MILLTIPLRELICWCVPGTASGSDRTLLDDEDTLVCMRVLCRYSEPGTAGARVRTMKPTRLLKDEDAVSPVIGVILMVAVTVILAAVIAAFVLGLGSGVSNAPQASFAYDFEPSGDSFVTGNDDVVEITHDGGDAIDNSTVSVLVEGNEATGSWSSAEITAGDTYTIDDSSESFDMASDDAVRVVWESQNSDKTSTLSSTTIP